MKPAGMEKAPGKQLGAFVCIGVLVPSSMGESTL